MSELYFPSFSANNTNGDAAISSAELQGVLCGLLCLNSQANRATWFNNLYEDLQADEDDVLALTHLFDSTVQSLNSLDFDLTLDFPEDNAPLVSRILALSDWCQGLIFGLATAGLTDDTDISIDGKEYIADVIKIGQINSDDITGSDTDEVNFIELVEYLRMGLFLIYSELQPEDNSPNTLEH